MQKKVRKSKLSYVLLLSDASVDIKEKNNLIKAEKQIPSIPIFESQESLYPLSSYASDDYYATLSDINGDWDTEQSSNFPLELAIGRLPVKTKNEALIIVNKLIQAQSTVQNSTISFVSDDEDYNIHVLDAEDFANELTTKAPQIEVLKTYIDALPMVASNNLYTSPEAQKKVKSLFNSEAGFIHFIGHGSESGWTDEKIFTMNDIVALSNSTNLPFLLTATCQFAKVDNPYILSGAEVLLNSDKGGAQGIIGTSRPVFQSNNYLFGKKFYYYLIQHISTPNYRLGDLYKEVKNASNNGIGNRNILLLADPSSPLPWMGKNLSISTENFTWSAPNKIQITNPYSEQINGRLSIYAGVNSKVTLGTKSPSFTYLEPGKLLYQKSINNISSSKLVDIPAIVNNQPGQATVRLNGSSTLNKYWAVQTILPKNKNVTWSDQEGPSIQQLQENAAQFILADSSGIGNLDKNGEESSVLINESVQIPLIKLIQTNFTDKKWEVVVNPNLLEKGENKIIIKAVDLLQNTTNKTFIVNNNTSAEAEFIVFPNPFIEEITVQFKSLSKWNTYQFQGSVYTMDGRRVHQTTGELSQNSLKLNLSGIAKNQKYILVIEILDEINRFKKTYISKIISGL